MPQKKGIKKPSFCIWLTGLSGSGKSTISKILEKKLLARGYLTYILDGDILRTGLNQDLSFNDQDRKENIRRVAEVTKVLTEAGVTTITSVISPFVEDRNFARSLFKKNFFFEVFVDASIQECVRRDPKGLYQKVKRGEIKNFTGVDSSYEAPTSPEIHLETEKYTADACALKILDYLDTHCVDFKMVSD